MCAARPIVLLRSAGIPYCRNPLRQGSGGNRRHAPYSPLHYLLLDELDKPLVATSGKNASGEPVLTDNAEAETRLAKVTRSSSIMIAPLPVRPMTP